MNASIDKDHRDGKVPPIFHGLAITTSSTTTTNTSSACKLRLDTPTQVEVKAVPDPSSKDTELRLGIEGVIFMRCMNAANGLPVYRITDSTGCATPEWEYDEDMAEAAAAFVNQKAEMWGLGVEAIKVRHNFGVDMDKRARRTGPGRDTNSGNRFLMVAMSNNRGHDLKAETKIIDGLLRVYVSPSTRTQLSILIDSACVHRTRN